MEKDVKWAQGERNVSPICVDQIFAIPLCGLQKEYSDVFNEILFSLCFLLFVYVNGKVTS